MSNSDSQRSVFVSYSRSEPDKTWVHGRLVPSLRRAGLSVVIDDESFAPGQTLSREIEKYLEDSRFVLAVLTPSYDMNRMAGKEAFLAMQSGRLVPVMVRKSRPPSWMQDLLWLDWTTTSTLDSTWPKLLKQLDAPIQNAPPPSPLAPRMRNRWIFAMVLLLGLIGLTAGLFRWRKPESSPQPPIVGMVVPSEIQSAGLKLTAIPPGYIPSRLALGSLSAKPGTFVDLDLTIEARSRDVCVVRFQLQLPPEITFESVSPGKVAVAEKKEVTGSLVDGVARVLIWGRNINPITTSGVVAIVRMRVAGAAFHGQKPISIQSIDAASCAADPIHVEGASGTISILE